MQLVESTVQGRWSADTHGLMSVQQSVLGHMAAIVDVVLHLVSNPSSPRTLATAGVRSSLLSGMY